MRTMACRLVAGPLCILLMAIALGADARADEFVPPSPVSRLAHGLNPANWSLPKLPDLRTLLPGSQEKARIKKKKNSLVEEVSKTASASWQRTRQALDPQKLIPMRMFPASARTPSAQPTAKEPGFFSSLFSFGKSSQDDEMTVNGFLRQSRPGQ